MSLYNTIDILLNRSLKGTISMFSRAALSVTPSQGCQVAVATAPLLKSGRRKSFGAAENSGP
jgi:hypothetical protein